MNNSSAPPVYSTTSSDTITLSQSTIDALTIDTSTMANITTAGIGNITIGGSGNYYTTGLAGGTVSIGSISTTISSIDSSMFTFNVPEEWEDSFPDFDRIQKMCEEYPGLKIAFEKFKTTYLLVKNHYDTPEDQRPRP